MDWSLNYVYFKQLEDTTVEYFLTNHTALIKGFVAKDRETLKTQYLFTEIMCINFNDVIFTLIASSAVTLLQLSVERGKI